MRARLCITGERVLSLYCDKAMAAQESVLVLDTHIRDWVLLPIVIVMFMVAIFRHNITKLLRSDRKTELKALKEG